MDHVIHQLQSPCPVEEKVAPGGRYYLETPLVFINNIEPSTKNAKTTEVR